MSRIRSIKPEFLRHDGIAELSPLHRLLFIGLWTEADRAGRLHDRPFRVKANVLPYDDADVDAMLNDLANHRDRFIVRYEVGGEKYIEIPSFLKHQRPHTNEVDSEIPPPIVAAKRVRSRSAASTTKVSSAADHGRQDFDRKGREGNRSGREGKESPPGEAPAVDVSAPPEAEQLAERLRSRILAHKPDARLPTTLAGWADTVRLMLTRDARAPDQIAAAIDWATSNEFWRANILSADKLREKFDTLELQMQRPRASPGGFKNVTEKNADALATARERLAAQGKL